MTLQLAVSFDRYYLQPANNQKYITSSLKHKVNFNVQIRKKKWAIWNVLTRQLIEGLNWSYINFGEEKKDNQEIMSTYQ